MSMIKPFTQGSEIMTDSNRRHFIASASALASFAALPVLATPYKSCEKSLSPVLHMVYFWLKKPSSSEDRNKLIAGLNALKKIPHIQALHIGLPASTLKRDAVDNSFDVSELMLFNSVEDQNAYQSHPLHKKFIDECSHLWQDVVVRDSISV